MPCNNKIAFLLLFFALHYSSKSQQGANFIALGSNRANPYAQFGLANNPANALENKSQVGMWYNNRFNFSGIQEAGFFAAKKINKAQIGMQLYWNGTPYFQNNKLTFQCAVPVLENIQIGIGIGANRIQQYADFSNHIEPTYQIGTSVQINKKWKAFAVVSNALLKKDFTIAEPTQIHTAVQYCYNENTGFVIHANVHSSAQFENALGISAYIRNKKKFTFVLHLQTGSTPLGAACLVQLKKIRFCLGLNYHTHLGVQNAVGIEYTSL